MSSHNRLPALKFRTSMLMLDDDQNFLKIFSSRLVNRGMSVEVTDNADTAVAMLKQQASLNLLSDEVFHLHDSDESDADGDASEFSLDAGSLQHFFTKHQGQQHFSTVIVDYDMPGMTGIEFCEQIKDLPIQKIMLTGQGSHKLAVEAFNKGIIDRFILKNAETIFDEVCEAIATCQQKYFVNVSNHFLDILSKSHTCAIGQTGYQSLLLSMLSQYNADEYYIFDEFGSYVLMNSQTQQQHYFIIRPSYLFDAYAATAEASGVDDQMISKIQDRKEFPILLDKDMEMLSVAQWNTYMKEMFPFGEDDLFFYTVA